jgi:hypothetical protein
MAKSPSTVTLPLTLPYRCSTDSSSPTTTAQQQHLPQQIPRHHPRILSSLPPPIDCASANVIANHGLQSMFSPCSSSDGEDDSDSEDCSSSAASSPLLKLARQSTFTKFHGAPTAAPHIHSHNNYYHHRIPRQDTNNSSSSNHDRPTHPQAPACTYTPNLHPLLSLLHPSDHDLLGAALSTPLVSQPSAATAVRDALLIKTQKAHLRRAPEDEIARLHRLLREAEVRVVVEDVERRVKAELAVVDWVRARLGVA